MKCHLSEICVSERVGKKMLSCRTEFISKKFFSHIPTSQTKSNRICPCLKSSVSLLFYFFGGIQLFWRETQSHAGYLTVFIALCPTRRFFDACRKSLRRFLYNCQHVSTFKIVPKIEKCWSPLKFFVSQLLPVCLHFKLAICSTWTARNLLTRTLFCVLFISFSKSSHCL